MSGYIAHHASKHLNFKRPLRDKLLRYILTLRGKACIWLKLLNCSLPWIVHHHLKGKRTSEHNLFNLFSFNSCQQTTSKFHNIMVHDCVIRRDACTQLILPIALHKPMAMNVTPDIPQSEIAATNFFDRAKSWAKNWAKNWAKFWTKFSGHFRASFTVQNDPPKFLPKLLPIYHFMSCYGSCGWKLKISSPRASGAWGAQWTFK